MISLKKEQFKGALRSFGEEDKKSDLFSYGKDEHDFWGCRSNILNVTFLSLNSSPKLSGAPLKTLGFTK